MSVVFVNHRAEPPPHYLQWLRNHDDQGLKERIELTRKYHVDEYDRKCEHDGLVSKSESLITATLTDRAVSMVAHQR